MPKTIFLDTQFVVALVNVHDENHSHAQELSYRFERSPLLTTKAVLLEIGNTLARSHRTQAVAIINGIWRRSDATVVGISDALLTEAISLYQRHLDKTWGLVDCLSFVVMRRHRVRDALTADQHFVQAGFVALMASS